MNRQEHLLVILAEECAEIQQEIAKALRFGLDDVYLPESTETNAESIIREVADFMGVLKMLQTEFYLDRVDHNRFELKRKRVEEFLKYSEERGKLYE
jgi:hypothetical protein